MDPAIARAIERMLWKSTIGVAIFGRHWDHTLPKKKIRRLHGGTSYAQRNTSRVRLQLTAKGCAALISAFSGVKRVTALIKVRD